MPKPFALSRVGSSSSLCAPTLVAHRIRPPLLVARRPIWAPVSRSYSSSSLSLLVACKGLGIMFFGLGLAD